MHIKFYIGSPINLGLHPVFTPVGFPLTTNIKYKLRCSFSSSLLRLSKFSSLAFASCCFVLLLLLQRVKIVEVCTLLPRCRLRFHCGVFVQCLGQLICVCIWLIRVCIVLDPQQSQGRFQLIRIWQDSGALHTDQLDPQA